MRPDHRYGSAERRIGGLRCLGARPAVRVAKRELRMECDYAYELQSQQRFKALIAGDPDTAQARGSARQRAGPRLLCAVLACTLFCQWVARSPCFCQL